MQLADPLEQSLVIDRPRRALAGGALVVGGRRHAQGPTDGLDPEVLAALVDERAHFGRFGSSSLAKNTEAAFRISLALRSSRFSRSSTFKRSRSLLVSRSWRLPASASAWRTQRRSASRWIPRSRATAAIGRPDSNTSRTARSRNSSGYFFGRGIAGGSPLPRTDRPGFEASVKPSPAHYGPLRNPIDAAREQPECTPNEAAEFVVFVAAAATV